MRVTGVCKQCSRCCKVIPLSKSWEEIKLMKGKDAEFVLSHFTPITQEQAYEWVPDVARELTEEDKKIGRKKNIHYFTCKELIDNKCSIYEERGDICSKYPYQEGYSEFTLASLIDQTICGYVPYAIKGEIKEINLSTPESLKIISDQELILEEKISEMVDIFKEKMGNN